MKKIFVLAAVIALVGVAVPQSNAAVVFSENFDSYTGISDPNFTNMWTVFGANLTDSNMLNEGPWRQNYLSISFDSPAGDVPPNWVSIGLAMDNNFNPTLDFTGASLFCDFRSNFEASLTGVLSLEIVAPVQDLGGNPLGYSASFRLLDANLLAIPAASEGWVTLNFGLAEDLRNPEAWWARPILTEVEKVQILVLQTGGDIVGAGTVDIDNLYVNNAVPEPGAMMLCGFAMLFGVIYRKRLNK